MAVCPPYRTYRETTGCSGTENGTGWHTPAQQCSQPVRFLLYSQYWAGSCLRTPGLRSSRCGLAVFHHVLLIGREVLQVALGDLQAGVAQALLQRVD